MQCRDARDLIDSFLGQELLVETNHELLRHLDGCPGCRADMDARSQLRAALKGAFDRTANLQMRPGFADEVAVRLRAARLATTGRPRSTARWLALAASLILVAAAGLYSLFGTHVSRLARQAAGDHQNCAVQFHLSERPISLADAAARYDSAYARLESTPPDVLPTDAGVLRVVDRHSCVFDAHRFGHVVFRLDTHVVSVLMTTDITGNGAAVSDGQATWLPPVDGLSMASFRTSGHIVFIVSDLPDAPFRQVARSLADPVSHLAQILWNISAPVGD